MAAKAAGLDEGDFLAWSEGAPNFDSDRDCRSVWRSIREDGGIKAGTLFALARAAGWRDEPAGMNGRPRLAEAPRRPQEPRKAPAKPERAPFDVAGVWGACEPATPDHAYIRLKLGLHDGLRVVPADSALTVNGKSVAGWLAVPLFDGGAGDAPATLQFIPPGGKGKLTAPGSMGDAWLAVGGRPTPGATVYVVEGIGQAWSVHQATRSPAVVTFGAGRMESVARALLECVPGVRVVLVADRGKEQDAERIARDLGCAWVAPPADFKKNEDLNDLHQREGLQAVAALLTQARESEADLDEPRQIDLAALATREPEPPAYIVPGWLPAGEPTLFAAHGGTGKSLTALHLAVCLTAGRDFYGVPVQPRGVDLVSFEDAEAVIHWRLHRVCKALGLSTETVAQRMRLFDGTKCVTLWFARGEHGAYGPTPAFQKMADRIGGPGRAVIVDGSSDTFGGSEIDRGQVKAFIRMLRRLVADDGALLLLAHVDKPAAKAASEAQGYSGSTGWHNGVRCRWYMFAETDEEGTETGNLVLEQRKNNYGATGHRMTLRFDPEAQVFVRVDEAPENDRPFQRADESEAIIAAVRAAWQAGDPIPAAQSGQRTAHAVCEARDDFPASLKGRIGRRRFYRALEQLRAAGKVFVQQWRKPNRHVVEVLNVRD